MMGWENVFHCEWNEFGQRVLKHYWPQAISYHDITKTDFTIHRGGIEIISGGFPCQPYSTAGKRLGKDDERHLWPEMLRAIREIQPRWVVGENVLGLVNWNGGMVFEEVQADLESEGYEVQPFILPAAGVNAPHRRDRVWFVAHAGSTNGEPVIGREWRKQGGQRNEIRNHFEASSSERDVRNTNSDKPKPQQTIQKSEHESAGICGRVPRNATNANGTMRERWQSRNKTQERPQSINQQFRRHNKLHRTDWQEFPTQPPLCSGDDGLPSELDGITFSKWRNESIKAAGNAIVPQVALQIFKAIEQYEHTISVTPTK